MITSFEVGSVFKILDEASPTLRKILKNVSELNKAIESVKVNMAALGKNPALAGAIEETRGLSAAWREVQKASAAANRSIGRATLTARGMAASGTKPAVSSAINQTRALIRQPAAGAAGATSSVQLSDAAAVGETNKLASAWERIALAATTAAGSAKQLATATRAALAPVPSAGGAGGYGGGGNRGLLRPGYRGSHGGGMHVSGPAIGVPGGAHVRFGGNMGGAAMGAAGLLGYGAYEAAQMEDTVWQMIYHSGQENTQENRTKFRKVLQDSMAESGYSLHDTGKAALQEIRMFQGTPGHGVDVLPEMMRASWIEARAKDSSLEESMKSFIGLAHMTKQYDPEAIKKLAPAFAYLSTSNPASLGSIEKAAGYAVPVLQSGLDVDPLQTLLLGTALTRAGATGTKSGTWLREMAVRSMPGTALFESTKKAEHHDELLSRLGLLDDKGQATWMVNGKPDLLRLLEIAGPALEKIPVSERAGVERKLFGAQGSGAISLLADPAVRNQVQSLRKEMDSQEFRNRYASFSDAYQQGSTVQNARTAIADFNNTMMDLGAHVLPAVNGALHDFKSMLEGIRNVIPGAKSEDGKAIIGKRGLEGAVFGGSLGFLIAGPQGALAGGVIGGVGGVASGYMEQQAAINKEKWKAEEQERSKAALAALRGPAVSGGVFPGGTRAAPPPNITLNLNVDGRALGQAISESGVPFNGFPTQAPAADGTGQFYGGDHNFPDK